MDDALLQMSFHQCRNVTAVVDRVSSPDTINPLGISVRFKVLSRVLLICR